MLELPRWLYAVCLVTIGVYGFFALPHLFIQHWYAVRHKLRLQKRIKLAAIARMEAQRAAQLGTVRVHRRHWYAWLVPGYDKHRAKALVQAKERIRLSHEPHSIKVWVTVYQEDPELLKACLHSLALQDYTGKFMVYVVDDASYLAQIEKYSALESEGSSNSKRSENYAERKAYYVSKREGLEEVFRLYQWHPRFKFILQETNQGKREAQQVAWVASHEDDDSEVLYGSVDSDTVVDPDAFSLLASDFVNPDIAAATGYVDVRNAKETSLTRLIDMRYWSAFHVERAAQSYHMAVMCCSGPLALYRASVVDQVMEQYVSQWFLGRLCTFGDDRHLTNLILRLGYLVVMNPRAHCLTQVPTTLPQYARQQTRWNKSFYREMLWTTGAIRTHSWYMTYDLACQAVLPFMLVLSLLSTVLLAVAGGGWQLMVLYLSTVVGIGFLRSLYGAIERRQWSFLLFSFYGLMYVFVLLPVRFYALATLGRTHWGTRVA